MATEILGDSPLTAALNAAIQPKLVEVGWSTGDDDSALAEYIILMLVNGKTQDQIAAELSGDLLNLGPDDPGARDFSQWLFEQVEFLRQQESTGPLGTDGSNQFNNTKNELGGQDAEMGDVSEGGDANVPTGPKSMRSGADRGRDKRLFGQLGKAMDRSDNVIHRVRGNDRINTHRAPPTGPRGGPGRIGRPAPGRSTGIQGMGASGPGGVAMSPQQQMEIFALLEQQSRMMAQMFTPQQQQAMMANGGQGPMMNGGFQQQQQAGRSLFDRVQPGRQQQNAGFRKNQQANGRGAGPRHNVAPVSAMDMELTPAAAAPSPDTTCKFNLSCTNKDCIFAHQSPAAPPGAAIDNTDTCAFGAACKNRKCTGRHPSPAQKIAHQTEQDCKFFPNCTNARCPFRHPTMPLCRNGADCTTANCKFTHVKTVCKFKPCLNPACAFKHEDGQKRGKFEDKVWVANEKEHVSERKFVDEDGNEELIKPEPTDTGMAQTELIA